MFKSIDDAVAAYVAKRDEMQADDKIAKARKAEQVGELDKISMWLRDKADELGVDSFKTGSGTAFRNIKTSYRIEPQGWDSFVKWVKENDRFDCLEKRAAKLAVKEFHDKSGTLPPGIAYVADVEFDVRRPSK